MAVMSITAGTVIDLIKKKIEKDGIHVVESHGRVQLYSGPARIVKYLFQTSPTNHDKGKEQAIGRNTLIDETSIGTDIIDNFNAGEGIYSFFKRLYKRDRGFMEADKVMRFVSKEFVKACYGNVETAICGVDNKNVFYEVELPELIKNKRVEAINDIPMQRIKDIYFTQGAYVAYREICKAELEIIKERAKKDIAGKGKADLKERLEFFKYGNIADHAPICEHKPEAIKRLGPINSHRRREMLVRQMKVPKGYKTKSIQLG